MIRFRFQLRPIEEVAPWGLSDPSLSWIGLTDGWYWIELDGHELLRYSGRAVRDPGRPWVDYQVMRLWEDLLTALPIATEPVPNELIPFVGSHPAHWRPAGGFQVDAAAQWHGRHGLDLSYLVDPPWIHWWRSAEEFTVMWRHPIGSDVEFSAPMRGRATVPIGAFVAAVQDFNSEFMAAMGQRVGALINAGGDAKAIVAEQDNRSTWFSYAVSRPSGTDWPAVRAGANQLLPLTAL